MRFALFPLLIGNLSEIAHGDEGIRRLIDEHHPKEFACVGIVAA